MMEGKNPISILQELCTKKGVSTHYELIGSHGAVHKSTFVFKVKAGDVSGIGKGQL